MSVLPPTWCPSSRSSVWLDPIGLGGEGEGQAESGDEKEERTLRWPRESTGAKAFGFEKAVGPAPWASSTRSPSYASSFADGDVAMGSGTTIAAGSGRFCFILLI